MQGLHIDIPGDVVLATGQSPEEFAKEAKVILALKLFELGRLSSGKAAELSGMKRVDFILSAGRLGVPVVDLDESEMDGEFREEDRRDCLQAARARYRRAPG